jgi:uncharacterized protein
MDAFISCFAQEAKLAAGSSMSVKRISPDTIIPILQECFPSLMAIYAFGSRIQGTAQTESDLDLAILVSGYADPLALWMTSSALAEAVGCPVDLLDFRATSTVMQYQILTTGKRWWAKTSDASLYEAAVLSEKTALDEARSGLLDDIQKTGRIYGR